jgi:hypothetical protein
MVGKKPREEIGFEDNCAQEAKSLIPVPVKNIFNENEVFYSFCKKEARNFIDIKKRLLVSKHILVRTGLVSLVNLPCNMTQKVYVLHICL